MNRENKRKNMKKIIIKPMPVMISSPAESAVGWSFPGARERITETTAQIV